MNTLFKMNKWILLSCLALLLTACLKDENTTAADLSDNQVIIQTNNGNNPVFDVELATTIPQQMQGLMHRTSLAENAGMLFLFQEEADRGFWMKNTLIPLDILFINSDGTIRHIHPEAVPQDLTRILSDGPVSGVLEINGGLAHRLGIEEGDVVLHPFFSKK